MRTVLAYVRRHLPHRHTHRPVRVIYRPGWFTRQPEH